MREQMNYSGLRLHREIIGRLLFDECDRPLIAAHSWCIRGRKRDRIATYIRKNGEVKSMVLARMLLNAPSDMYVDHINHNPFDNRRCNLRLCTHQQNNYNRSYSPLNTSGYKGITWRKNRQCWETHIRHRNKLINLGGYPDKLTAHAAYLAAAFCLHGDFMCPSVKGARP